MNTERSNPHRLYKNQNNKVIFGVCSGLAEYFNVSLLLFRVCTFFALWVFGPLVFFGYIFLAIALENKPLGFHLNPEDGKFWRTVSFTPANALSEIHGRFRNMNERLANMESYVSSKSFALENEYKKL